jgi:hypothetical protein
VTTDQILTGVGHARDYPRRLRAHRSWARCSISSGRRNRCRTVAGGCDIIRADAGRIAAIFMGLALANQRGFDIPARRPFSETLVQLIIGVLFISISATVTPQSLPHLVLPTLGLVAVLVFVARPIVAFASTRGRTSRNASPLSSVGRLPR